MVLLASGYAEVETQMVKLQETAKSLLDVTQRKLFWFELLIQRNLQRSYDLLWAVSSLVRLGNCSAAATLLRPMLDCFTVLVTIVKQKNPEALAKHMGAGKRLDKYIDDFGNKLTDKAMLGYCSEVLPEAGEMYKDLSRYIHFSSQHIAPAFDDMKNGRFTGEVGKNGADWPDDDKNRILHGVSELASLICFAANKYIEHRAGLKYEELYRLFWPERPIEGASL